MQMLFTAQAQLSHTISNKVFNTVSSNKASVGDVPYFTTTGDSANWAADPNTYTISPYGYPYTDGTTVYPIPGTITVPGTIYPTIEPFPFAPPQPTIFPFEIHIPQILPDPEVDILVLPKDKGAKRSALRKELESLEEPITDLPKRPYRRIVRPDTE